MKELTDIRFNETDIILEDNRVKGTILPKKAIELNRNIIFKGNTIVEGAVYAHRLEVHKGDLVVEGAVFTDLELHVNTDATGDVKFAKCVGSANSIVSRAKGCKVIFGSDVNAKSVTLVNAFVAGSIYAEQIELINCVVIGGVFSTGSAELTNCVVGTFNAPEMRVSGNIQLLLPSAFTRQPINHAADARLYNIALADLGALYRGMPQNKNSGRIEMSFQSDSIKSRLVDKETGEPTNILSYSVVGKVLTADLIDIDNFQNHFLLSAASLGTQLLKTYDLGMDANGKPATLEIERIRDFFMKVLDGEIDIQPLDSTFSMAQIASRLS